MGLKGFPGRPSTPRTGLVLLSQSAEEVRAPGGYNAYVDSGKG